MHAFAHSFIPCTGWSESHETYFKSFMFLKTGAFLSESKHKNIWSNIILYQLQQKLDFIIFVSDVQRWGVSSVMLKTHGGFFFNFFRSVTVV